MDERSSHAGRVGDIQLVARARRDAAGERVVPENRFDVGAALAVVVDAGPVARKRAPADGGPRPGEHGQGCRAMFGQILAAGQQADDVDAMLATLPTKRQFSIGATLVQQIDRGAGRLRAVVAEDAVAEERVLRLSKVFDRDAAAAGLA